MKINNFFLLKIREDSYLINFDLVKYIEYHYSTLNNAWVLAVIFKKDGEEINNDINFFFSTKEEGQGIFDEIFKSLKSLEDNE